MTSFFETATLASSNFPDSLPTAYQGMFSTKQETLTDELVNASIRPATPTSTSANGTDAYIFVMKCALAHMN